MTTQSSDSDILPTEKKDPLRDSAILGDQPLPEGLGGSIFDEEKSGESSLVGGSTPEALPEEMPMNGGSSVFGGESDDLSDHAANILQDVEDDSQLSTDPDSTGHLSPGDSSSEYEYEYEEIDEDHPDYHEAEYHEEVEHEEVEHEETEAEQEAKPAYRPTSRQQTSSLGMLLMAGVLGPLTVLIIYFVYSSISENPSKPSNSKKQEQELDDLFPGDAKGLSEQEGFQPQSQKSNKNQNRFGRKFGRTDFRNENEGLLIPEELSNPGTDELDEQEKRAKELLRLARKLVKRNPSAAQGRLSSIITDFPATEAAQEARTLLAILQQ